MRSMYVLTMRVPVGVGREEAVLQLELKQPRAVVLVPRREAVRRVEREDAHAPGVQAPGGIDVRFLVSDLDEQVAGHASRSGPSPRGSRLAVVLLPHPLQDRRHDRRRCRWRLEADTAPEGEVGQVVAQRAHVVEGELRLAKLPAVRIVVTEVVRPVEDVPRQPDAVDLHLLVREVDQPERGDLDGEV